MPTPPPHPRAAPAPPSPPAKRRRGRQPRPSLLTPRVKAAVAAFANAVGQPKVIEPAGFRDFRGWLAFIGGPSAVNDWEPLVAAVLADSHADQAVIHRIKPDLVREIVKAVVIPREGESSKLVSTNCGRQCARPSTGVTLMTILDRVFANLTQWRQLGVSEPYSYETVDRRSQLPYSQPRQPSNLGRSSGASPSHHHGVHHVQPSYDPEHNAPRVDRYLPQRLSHAPRQSASPHQEAASSQQRQQQQLQRDPQQQPQHQSHQLAPQAAAWDNSQTGSHSGIGRREAPPTLPSFRELEDSLFNPRRSLGKRARD